MIRTDETNNRYEKFTVAQHNMSEPEAMDTTTDAPEASSSSASGTSKRFQVKKVCWLID